MNSRQMPEAGEREKFHLIVEVSIETIQENALHPSAVRVIERQRQESLSRLIDRTMRNDGQQFSAPHSIEWCGIL